MRLMRFLINSNYSAITLPGAEISGFQKSLASPYLSGTKAFLTPTHAFSSLTMKNGAIQHVRHAGQANDKAVCAGCFMAHIINDKVM